MAGLLAALLTLPQWVASLLPVRGTNVLSASPEELEYDGTLDSMPESSGYEINIDVTKGDYGYATEQSHLTFPSSDVLVALKDEAVATFEALFPDTGPPDAIVVGLTRHDENDAKVLEEVT